MTSRWIKNTWALIIGMLLIGSGLLAFYSGPLLHLYRTYVRPPVFTGGATLKPVATIDLPGAPGKRFDYLTVDADDGYLLSAHLDAGLLYVIDLQTNRLVKAIPGVPGAEGVEYVPEFKKAYVSDWYEKKVAVVDLRSMTVIKKLKTEDKPDGSTYAAPYHKLYVSDERGKAVTVIDVRTDAIVTTLRFKSDTGMPQYDPVAKKVYVNLQDQNVFAVIDPATDTVVARYPVGTCKGNHGMALDAAHHRAFLSCEDNDLMTVFDLDTHKPIATLPMAPGADVIQFDPGLGSEDYDRAGRGRANQLVPVKVNGLTIKPFAGLGSYAAFKGAMGGTVVMGDTVVFQDEVNPAMDAAFANGLQVTGIHNHFFFDEPKVYFMHIGGQGDAATLAKGVKAVWDAIKTVRAARAQPATAFGGDVPTYGKIDAPAIEKVLGHPSESQTGAVKVTIGRDMQMGGETMDGSMGITTWAAFSGSDQDAVVFGDFAMTQDQVQRTLQALRKANLSVLALHNHMMDGQPSLFFTHYWGQGTTADLAARVKSVLDAQR